MRWEVTKLIKNEGDLTHLVRLNKDNSSCDLGLCIHFLNFTKGG